MACSNKELVKTVYTYPEVTVPEEPTYYSVKWNKTDGFYCVDIDNAKNLLKNYKIMNTYKDELKQLLIDLANRKRENETR